jgi:hypothetical protein
MGASLHNTAGKLQQNIDLDSIRAYLSRLAPEEQAKHLRSIEAGSFSDYDISIARIIEQQLRFLLRQSGYYRDRISNPSRTFFEPIQHVLVDGDADTLKGEISRKSLRAIWAWISLDLIPDETKTYSAAVKEAADSNSFSLREEVAQEFRTRVITMCEIVFGIPRERATVQQRLTFWAGPPGTFDALRTIVTMLKQGKTI